MGKKLTVSELRAQLGTVLDQLDSGQTHFVIERNNQEVAVLLSMEKFRDIMQMLEMLNTLDFIETGAGGLEQNFSDTGLSDFPDLTILRPTDEAAKNSNAENQPITQTPQPRTATGRDGSSIEDVAAKLGIRIIK
ncbi:MAG: Antitoxin [Chloroflexi bacterium]|jgi:prevent-host-death family protein|nr:Antitoxin [Chloroflexota bacterium]